MILLEHDHLIEIDLFSIKEGHSSLSSDALDTSFSTPIYLTIPDEGTSSSKSQINSRESLYQERQRWIRAFERSHLSYLRDSTFLNPSGSSSKISLPSPKGFNQENRLEERRWWTGRLSRVREEMSHDDASLLESMNIRPLNEENSSLNAPRILTTSFDQDTKRLSQEDKSRI
jgi:hypothetical protein